MTKRTLWLWGAGLAVLVADIARAERPIDEEDPKIETRDDGAWAYELSFGFATAVRNEGRAGYVLTGGGAALTPGAGGVVTALRQSPYDAMWVNGPAWELRTTARHLRMTIGAHKPFAALAPGDVLVTETIDGAERTVGARALSLWELRLGLGVEYTFKRIVTPFMDLVGDVQWAWLDLTVDGVPAKFEATSFGYAIRGGARLSLDEHLYVSASGEVGLVGPTRFGAQLLVGWRFGG